MASVTETEIAVLRWYAGDQCAPPPDCVLERGALARMRNRLNAAGLLVWLPALDRDVTTVAGRIVLALLDQVEELTSEREEARDCLNTIIDEEFGLQPPEPGESLNACLTRLETLLREAHKRRYELNREQSGNASSVIWTTPEGK